MRISLFSTFSPNPSFGLILGALWSFYCNRRVYWAIKQFIYFAKIYQLPLTEEEDALLPSLKSIFHIFAFFQRFLHQVFSRNPGWRLSVFYISLCCLFIWTIILNLNEIGRIFTLLCFFVLIITFTTPNLEISFTSFSLRLKVNKNYDNNVHNYVFILQAAAFPSFLWHHQYLRASTSLK